MTKPDFDRYFEAFRSLAPTDEQLAEYERLTVEFLRHLPHSPRSPK